MTENRVYWMSENGLKCYPEEDIRQNTGLIVERMMTPEDAMEYWREFQTMPEPVASNTK